MPKYERDAARLIDDETGREILPGEKVTTRGRGEEAVFLYVSRLPEPGKSGKVFTDIRPGGEFYPSVVGAHIELADRFKGFTPDAIHGVLFIESRADRHVLEIARDADHTSKQYDLILAYMNQNFGRGTNPSWITSAAAKVAYHRDLIDGEEFNKIVG